MTTAVIERASLRDPAVWLAGAAAASTVLSIAAFETLIALALAAVIVQREWRWPRITLPAAVWFALTIASAAASGDARAALPQIKKFYVYLMLFVVFAAFREIWQIRWLVAGWAAGAALSAGWSLIQLARKYRAAEAAHQNFYVSYVGARITGFMGHWMTFSGQMMIALLLSAAFLMFAKATPLSRWLMAAALLITIALIAAFTRSMWLGAFGGGVYLLWIWRRWIVLAIPPLAAVALLAGPAPLRERALSVVRPHGQVDSNAHRDVTRRIGYQMIKAHPWFGLGPEEVGPHVMQYLPADVKPPLPEGYYGHLHNIYVHYAAERGIPAALALMWVLGQALFDFARGLRRAPQVSEVRWVLHGAIAVMIAVMLSGFYELNLGDSEVLGMFLAVVACGYAAIEISKSDSVAAGR
jgi:putative inorganic carbon (HCO3(-)) transporter